MNLQCKDIPDEPILTWLNQRRIDGKSWACWFDGFENSITHCMPNNIPSKLRIAKMKKLIGRGLVSGCPCGCRGDFEITPSGIEYLEENN